ncbi:MAG: bifunctional homocysteine S-methyltransferase/methylenetetrahydrofolate reductase [Agathobacter sp.]|nr:bifunctional homocysteine S-methyltransferase/methylenetetrahydrofolate reductase [Agathobacter sp.]
MFIREYLQEKKIITDGAFGTYYASKYSAPEEIPERANINYPDRVKAIHQEYIVSGAKLIRTNTFASNTVILEENIEGVKANICSAVEIANSAVKAYDDSLTLYVSGDIGPIPAPAFIDRESVMEEYKVLAETFIEKGVSILIFESFAELDVIIPAIEHAKKLAANSGMDLFIIVQFALNQFGYSAAGLSARKLIEDASKINEIDALGFNCGIGPAHMQSIMEKIVFPDDKFITSIPNAGYPKISRNQIKYSNTAKYFEEKMQELADFGSDILGGCCGTNPTFIEGLAQKLELSQKPRQKNEISDKKNSKPPIRKGFIYDENGNRKNKKLIAVELAPPFDCNDEKLLESAHGLANLDIDVLTFPDSPSGRTRVDSVLMASKVHQETGLAVMPHICCRDKNAVAMRSLFLGAQINDIHNALIITGDPLPQVARETVKAVFNFDSTGLMSIVKEMNEDSFLSMPFSYGGAINQNRRNLEVEIKRIKKKIDCGAEFFLTQPVFSEQDVERLRLIKKETGATILCGIMPLVSRKNAIFMKNEIAGVNVTDEVVNMYPENGTKEQGEAVGIKLAKKMMAATEDFVDGYYFSFPFNRTYMLKSIL